MRIVPWILGLSTLGLLTGCGSGGGGGIPGSEELVQMTTEILPNGTTGIFYSTRVEAIAPHPPGIFYVSAGQLPTGVDLDEQTGEITGYPRHAGVFHLEIAARDGLDTSLPPDRDNTLAEDRRRFTITMALGMPNILPQSPPTAQYRAGYSYPIAVAGGSPPYEFVKSAGTLPEGVTVSLGGLLGGFPTQAVPPNYPFAVTVTDSQGFRDTEALEFNVIVLPLIIGTILLPEAARDFPYDTVLALSTVGGGAPHVWTQVPPVAGEVDLATIGMELSANGHLRNAFGTTGPTQESPAGGWRFTLKVVDEAQQVATRAYALTVNPGPIVTKVTPNRSSAAPPYTITGLNFQPGAVVILKPGPTQVALTPTFLDATTLRINSLIPPPPGGGAVTVRVQNPDGGFDDLPAGFLFPFANLAFGQKGFVGSNLASTGLAVADLDGDGRAEIVHSGAASYTVYPGGATSPAGTGGLHYLRNQGGLAFSSTTLDTQNYYDVKILDVTSDGIPDVVALATNTVRTWVNDGNGNLSVGPVSNLQTGFSFPSEMSIGFFNNDALPDFAYGVAHYVNLNGQVHKMVGNGSGGFTPLDSATTTLTATNGVVSLACLDFTGDGLWDVAAGGGFNNPTGPFFRRSVSTQTGLFGAWTASANTPAAYANTLGVAAGDFFGNGTPAVLVMNTQDTADGGQRNLSIFSGSSLTTQNTLTAPSSLGKCVCAADFDLDPMVDFAVTHTTGLVTVYRGSTKTAIPTLDSTSGSPSISSARTGRVASGDLDGDGRIDLVATTSYWAIDYQPNIWGATFALNLAGMGSPAGVVFWLNSSN